MAKKKNKSNDLKQCELFVDGMHCASCEVLIEKKLLKMEGIESVDASSKDNRVRVVYKDGQKPEAWRINHEFESYGYKFSTKKFKKDNSPMIQFFEDGSVKINKSKLKNRLGVLVIVVSLIIAFFVVENLQLGRFASVDTSSSLPAFVLLGLVAGFSSCAALIGGLLLSMTKQWNEMFIASDSDFEKAQPHIMFHTGRLISFTILGGVLGLLGDAVSLNNTTVYSFLVILVSIVMLLLALQMLGVGWAQSFKITAPKSLVRFAADETNFKGRYMPFAIGALTFFLPCGFTLIAQSVALTTGSFWQGAFVMLFFAVGTLIPLMTISFSGLKFNSKPHLTARFNVVAGLLILFFVIYNINGQLNVLGYPSLSDIDFSSSSAGEQSIVAENSEGEQVIKFIAKGFEYTPTTSTVVYAGKTTILEIDNQGILGCGAFVSARGLFDNFIELKPGINKIILNNPKVGDYKLTCSMGMVRPVNIRVV